MLLIDVPRVQAQIQICTGSFVSSIVVGLMCNLHLAARDRFIRECLESTARNYQVLLCA